MKKQDAEEVFRQAFQRLQDGSPLNIDRSAKISQNNVAKEAGRDPSALRKSRYPLLINDIRQWIVNNKKISIKIDEFREPSKERITELSRQRDELASMLLEADAKILELTHEIKKLRNE